MLILSYHRNPSRSPKWVVHYIEKKPKNMLENRGLDVSILDVRLCLSCQILYFEKVCWDLSKSQALHFIFGGFYLLSFLIVSKQFTTLLYCIFLQKFKKLAQNLLENVWSMYQWKRYVWIHDYNIIIIFIV